MERVVWKRAGCLIGIVMSLSVMIWRLVSSSMYIDELVIENFHLLNTTLAFVYSIVDAECFCA